MRVLFQHGQDPTIGDKPLGPIDVLEEDGTGPRYEVPLLDTSYNRDLEPGLRAGLYGASFRFASVPRSGTTSPRSRGTTPADCQSGPSPTPASTSSARSPSRPARQATAGVRSITDSFRGLPVEPSQPQEALPMEDEVVYFTRDEKAARVTELRASLDKIAIEHPGVLPGRRPVSLGRPDGRDGDARA